MKITLKKKKKKGFRGCLSILFLQKGIIRKKNPFLNQAQKQPFGFH
jgi:hypothetical protein